MQVLFSKTWNSSVIYVTYSMLPTTYVITTILKLLDEHIIVIRIITHCYLGPPARSPAGALRSVSAPGCRTSPPAARTPAACWGTTSSPRSPRVRSWWDSDCPSRPTCRRGVNESGKVYLGKLPAVTEPRRDRSRRNTGAGAAEIVAATLTSKCPSRRKAW